MLKGPTADFLTQTSSGVRDWTLQMDYDYLPSPTHDIRFGISLAAQRFEPEVLQIRDFDRVLTYNNDNRVDALTLAAYLEDDMEISPKLGLNIGLRSAVYQVNAKSYPDIQPRASLRYSWNNSLSFKASYNYMVQYIHLLTNSSLGAPTDLWVSSTERIKPQYSQQIAFGVFKNIESLKMLLSVETYYKWLDNLIEYRDGANYLFNTGETWQNKVAVGQGEAYGLEFLLQRDYGKLNGWLSYTLSWSNRQVEGVNEGRVFPFKYDRRHSFSAVLNYEFRKGKSLSLVFVYQSGNAITLAEATYQGAVPPTIDPRNEAGFEVLPYIAERNGYRMPAYHRMDLSYHTDKQKQKVKRAWIFSVYNLYSRLNAFFLYQTRGQLKQVSLFPIIPSVTYQLEF
ncbi:MAG: TonB-dependent receptor [Microscillaceae bacterium]|nr:TonB-dependent receptor [Microscillaceae bacterium]